jgi:ADP-heptose:LPS heptosyltransferase
LKLLRKIYKAGFDIAIQPTYSREFSYGDAIIRISGAKERIGSIGDYCNIRPLEKKISDKFYTRLIPAIQCPLMELKRNAEFVCGLDMRVHAGLPDISPAIDGMKNPLNTVSDYYVLFPGASRSGKQWPIDRFTALSNKIYGKYGLTGVICGSPAEQDLVQELILHINVPIINMTGKTNLVNLAVIIRNALFLVANDTSAIHIAAAVSTPGFCILGGWHYGRFIPYDIENKMEKPLPIPITHEMDCSGCNWRCQYPYEKSGPVPCIEKISVDEVFSVIEDKINKMKKA